MGLVPPEVFAGAPPAGLDLVGDQQDAAGVEFLLEGTEEPIGVGGEPADLLDRFGDQAGDIAGRHHVEHLGEIVDTRLGEGGRQDRGTAAEAVAALHETHIEPRDRGRRPRTGDDGLGGERTTVIAVPHRQHLIALAVAGGEQKRRVVGLRARGGEEDPGTMPDRRQMRSASSIIGSLRYSVEVCITFAACSCTPR